MKIDMQRVAQVLHDPRRLTYSSPPRELRGKVSKSDACIAMSDQFPEIAVVFYPGRGLSPDHIVTVVWREKKDYVRKGDSYETKPGKRDA